MGKWSKSNSWTRRVHVCKVDLARGATRINAFGAKIQMGDLNDVSSGIRGVGLLG